jgi:hypothetical protein
MFWPRILKYRLKAEKSFSVSERYGGEWFGIKKIRFVYRILFREKKNNFLLRLKRKWKKELNDLNRK